MVWRTYKICISGVCVCVRERICVWQSVWNLYRSTGVMKYFLSFAPGAVSLPIGINSSSVECENTCRLDFHRACFLQQWHNPQASQKTNALKCGTQCYHLRVLKNTREKNRRQKRKEVEGPVISQYLSQHEKTGRGGLYLVIPYTPFNLLVSHKDTYKHNKTRYNYRLFVELYQKIWLQNVFL